MRHIGYVIGALIASVAFASVPAAANVCQAGKLSCATTMPVDGYCECTSHGMTQDGTVVPGHATRKPINSTAGGCGANPGAPGCH